MKIFRKTCLALALILVVSVAAAGFLSLYVYSFNESHATTHKECAVVFGAAVLPGGKPSRALYDRSVSAAKLYKEEVVDCIILAGAQSAYGAHEVDVMRDIELQNGVNLSDINFDFDANNTLKTIEHLDKDGSYVFVSNDFHLARINMFAKYLGLEDYELQASTYTSGQKVDEIYWIGREVVAIVYYFFTLILF